MFDIAFFFMTSASLNYSEFTSFCVGEWPDLYTGLNTNVAVIRKCTKNCEIVITSDFIVQLGAALSTAATLPLRPSLSSSQLATQCYCTSAHPNIYYLLFYSLYSCKIFTIQHFTTEYTSYINVKLRNSKILIKVKFYQLSVILLLWKISIWLLEISY